MTTAEILTQIQKKKSFLCIGLDVDLNKIPSFLLEKEDPIFEFNKAIIDATHHLCVAYKPNTAFYEAYYARGICFETLGNIAQAEVDYKRAIEINPDYKYAKDALQNLKTNNQKYN